MATKTHTIVGGFPTFYVFAGGLLGAVLLQHAAVLNTGTNGIVSSRESTVSSLQSQIAQLTANQQRLERKWAALTGRPSDAVPRRKIFPKDFSKFFAIDNIDGIEIDPSIAELVKKHDVTKDDAYDAQIDGYFSNLFSPYIENGFKNDQRIYVAFADKDRGFGVFANVDIPAGKVIAEYTGVLTNSTASTDYQWTYNSILKNEEGRDVYLSIDSRIRGNILRFVNHEDKPNCDVVHIPYKGLWHTLYVSNKFIPKDSELSVSYGDQYWESRRKVLTQGELTQEEIDKLIKEEEEELELEEVESQETIVYHNQTLKPVL